MSNTNNDFEKHKEAWANHFAALEGGRDGRWRELTASELCHLLAKSALGLNGGELEKIPSAMKTVGFNYNNLIPIKPGKAQVVTLIEFQDEDVA
jgi:hypothetical protein